MNASEIEYKNGWYDEEKDESGSFRWMGKTAFALLKDCSVPGRKHIRFIAGHTFPTKKSPILSVFVNDRLAMEREIDDTFSPYFFPLKIRVILLSNSD